MNVDAHILDEVAAQLEHDGPLTIGTMFRSPGIRARGKIVAFLGHENRLILKLPRDRAVALVADGDAQEVTMGTRTMREWIAVPARADHEATLASWAALAQEALDYVVSLIGDDETDVDAGL
ncbi:hypothetical protein JNB62_17025 [Microbacterium jejuense]|uniref:TfoX N-terminal domain-containing protein n=1 Tax=Microbacterium jejuense TaxID=1263637 RepID=A0ABS7HR01_9MICO|nr:TfoX/Sxy family protein [Microbacterium jejuense]MBW9095386.1 hypothetical protein [Microbacterium jejuense]